MAWQCESWTLHAKTRFRLCHSVNHLFLCAQDSAVVISLFNFQNKAICLVTKNVKKHLFKNNWWCNEWQRRMSAETGRGNIFTSAEYTSEKGLWCLLSKIKSKWVVKRGDVCEKYAHAVNTWHAVRHTLLLARRLSSQSLYRFKAAFC